MNVRGWLCAGVVCAAGMLVICGWAVNVLAGRVDIPYVPAGGWDVDCTA